MTWELARSIRANYEISETYDPTLTQTARQRPCELQSE